MPSHRAAGSLDGPLGHSVGGLGEGLGAPGALLVAERVPVAVPAPPAPPALSRRERRAAERSPLLLPEPPAPVVPLGGLLPSCSTHHTDVPAAVAPQTWPAVTTSQPVTTPQAAPTPQPAPVQRGRRRADAAVDAPAPRAAATTAGLGAQAPAARPAPAQEAQRSAPRRAARALMPPPAPVEAPMTRRALREVRQLETALALPSTPTAPGRPGAPAPLRAKAAVAAAAAAAAPSLPATSAFAPSRGRRPHRQAPRAAVRPVFGLPQAGMVGVLGLATLVAPLAAGQTGADASASGATAELAAVPADPGYNVVLPSAEVAAVAVSAVASPAATGALDAAELVARRQAAEQASRTIGERTVAAQAAAARQAEEAAAVQQLVPGCDGVVTEAVVQSPNGRLPTDELCELWEPGHRLRADGAVAFAKLNAAFRAEFGDDMELTDTYRSYAAQVAVRSSKPGLSAKPGTSQHGWGLAVDLGGGVQKADEHYRWLAEHADDYGWENPDWARRGGSGPYEPWHWEFAAGRHADTDRSGGSGGAADDPSHDDAA